MISTSGEFRYLSIDSEGLILKGHLCLSGRSDPGPLVILCHGIPLSRPDPSDTGYQGMARMFADRGINTVFFNLRGTGESEGDFHPVGWVEDLDNVVRYSLEELRGPHGGVYLVGSSAGGALGIRAAVEEDRIRGVAGLAVPARISGIFDRAYAAEFAKLAREVGIIRDPHYPSSPEELFEGLDQLDPVDYVARLAPRPLLLIQGEEDELIPVRQARELYKSAREPKRLELLPGAGHRLRHDERAVRLAIEWVAEMSGLEGTR